MAKRQLRDTLIRNGRHPNSTAHHGPRAFRVSSGTNRDVPGRTGSKRDAEQPQSPAALIRLFLDHLADGALSARGKPYSPKTVQSYREALTRFLADGPTFGLPDDVRALRTSHIDGFGGVLRKAGCRPATVANWTAAVAAWATWLVAQGVLKRSFATGRKRVHTNAEPIEPFSAEELGQLFAACDTKSWLGSRDAALLWVLLDTGLRAAELCALDLADVDRVEWTVTVRHGKGDKYRRARLGIAARRRLGDFLVLFRGDAAGPLFPGRIGQRLTRNALSNRVRRLGQAAGVEQCHPHRFRHTFALEFLRAGGDVFRLQILLGHSSLEMTRRYVAALSMEDALQAHETASPADSLAARAMRR